DVDLARAELLCPARADRALEIVRWHHAAVVRLTAWLVHLRLVWLTLAGLGQTWIGVRRTDHDQVGAVQNWNRHFSRARIEAAEGGGGRRTGNGGHGRRVGEARRRRNGGGSRLGRLRGRGSRRTERLLTGRDEQDRA